MGQIFIMAFMLGILGSFHCVGMCGPLALSLPLNDNNPVAKLSDAFIYNAGRVVTYSFFGLVFGLIGKSMTIFGFQQWLSISVGILILFFVMAPKRFNIQSSSSSFIAHFFGRVRRSFGQLFFKKNRSTLFSIGLLNGLLPCGLVYVAAAGAIATGDIANSILFMAFFGMGTLPIMWSIAFFGNYVGVGIRQKIRKAYPYMMTLMACLLILRGMGLGIPYISPRLNAMKANALECCAKP